MLPLLGAGPPKAGAPLGGNAMMVLEGLEFAEERMPPGKYGG